jgi:hypothetical protein
MRHMEEVRPPMTTLALRLAPPRSGLAAGVAFRVECAIVGSLLVGAWWAIRRLRPEED